MATLTRTAARRWSSSSGSDLHLTTNTPPQIRVHGKLQPLDLPPLGAGRDQGARLQRADRRAEEALRGDARARLLVRHPRPRPLPLQRVQPARRRRRRLPVDPRADQGLRRARPAGGASATLAERPRGLVLVTGPTGSGKSTTLAAMIDKINTERHEHILTIEDPIEYVHQHKGCLVNQREVHSDTHGLRRRRCAPRCARTPTSSSSARCATSRRSSRRCASPRRAT